MAYVEVCCGNCGRYHYIDEGTHPSDLGGCLGCGYKLRFGAKKLSLPILEKKEHISEAQLNVMAERLLGVWPSNSQRWEVDNEWSSAWNGDGKNKKEKKGKRGRAKGGYG